jgi:hypothetical protein
MFKAEPQPPARKVLYRRGGLSHILSHSLSHSLSHRTYGLRDAGPITPPAREGHRRRFSEADKRQIVGDAVWPGASLSEVARRYGIATRVLFRWKQELSSTAVPEFVAVRITDANAPSDTPRGDGRGSLGFWAHCQFRTRAARATVARLYCARSLPCALFNGYHERHLRCTIPACVPY